MTSRLTLKYMPGKWLPTSVPILEEHLGSLLVSNEYFEGSKITPLKKNLAYSLQHIEFLDRVIKDINLTTVLWTQNVKSFIVHGASVIEAIFHYLVVSSGHGNKTDWKSLKKTQTNEMEINGGKYRHELVKIGTLPLLIAYRKSK